MFWIIIIATIILFALVNVCILPASKRPDDLELQTKALKEYREKSKRISGG